MGMDLCYYGIKEENMPEILEGNFLRKILQIQNQNIY